VASESVATESQGTSSESAYIMMAASESVVIQAVSLPKLWPPRHTPASPAKVGSLSPQILWHQSLDRTSRVGGATGARVDMRARLLGMKTWNRWILACWGSFTEAKEPLGAGGRSGDHSNAYNLWGGVGVLPRAGRLLAGVW
jgi:hypothetical protein